MAQVRIVANRRAGPWAGLGDVDDAAFNALVLLGFSPADPTSVQDSDLLPITTPDVVPALLDVIEWRMLDSICNNATEADLRRVGVCEDPERARALLRARADATFERVRRAYGVGLPTLGTGLVDLDFQEHARLGEIFY
jgi:hypothetical protein